MGKYYGAITGYDETYPYLFLNGLYETATIAELRSMLEGYGITYNDKRNEYRWDGVEIDQGPMSDCIALNGGGWNCAPQGGWPTYATDIGPGTLSLSGSVGPLEAELASNGEVQGSLGYNSIWCFVLCLGFGAQGNLNSNSYLEGEGTSFAGFGMGGMIDNVGMIIRIGIEKSLIVDNNSIATESKFLANVTIGLVGVEIGYVPDVRPWQPRPQ